MLPLRWLYVNGFTVVFLSIWIELRFRSEHICFEKSVLVYILDIVGFSHK